MATTLTTASPFRRTMGLAGALNHEWTARYADASHCYGDWLVLTGSEALSFLQGATPAQRDGRFHFMLRCSSAGDSTAARVLLQAMLPKAIRFAATCRGLQAMPKEEATCSALAAMCEAIGSYKLHKTKSVTGNLACGALGLITNNFPANEKVVSVDNILLEEMWSNDQQLAADIPSESGPAEFGSAFDEVMTVLSWAKDTGILTAREVQLLGTYSTMSIDEAKAWAQSQGRTYRNLSNQVSDIRMKLKNAVKETGLIRGSW